MRSLANIWRNLPLKAKIGVGRCSALFILAAIIGPMVAAVRPGYENPIAGLSLQPPSAQHLFGTTQTGQDVLSQVLTGIRLTLELALAVGVIATVRLGDRRGHVGVPRRDLGRACCP